jgi:hypothetical protein
VQATQCELWRPIPGYEGAYEVSDHGRVRSLDREVYAGRGRTRKSVGRVLSAHFGDHYVKVRLKLHGSGRTWNVHTLVALAFIGPKPEGMEVCHGNGDAHDNRAANLRYDTHSANGRDRTLHGRDRLANRTHCNKGHEFTEANTFIRAGANESGRRCRTCERDRASRRTAAGEYRKAAA